MRTVWSDDKIARLAAFLGGYSALWTLAFPALSKLRRPDPRAESEPSVDQINSLPAPSSLLDRYRLQLAQFLADWAAAIAGAVAGLALLAQSKQERVNLAPNIFCRSVPV
jgi:hypothetical protein